MALSSRTKKIFELAQASHNSDDEFENFVDRNEDIENVDEVSETEDNVEETVEESDEISIDSDADDEIMETNFDDMWVGKDETFWLKTPFTRRRALSKNVIRRLPGISSAVSRSCSIAELFKLFISQSIVNCIVASTNQKGAIEMQKIGENAVWKDVDDTEIYAFIGILICAGALKSSREPVRMMWTDDCCFKRPIYSATMPRSRFSQISSWMRFDNADTRLERRQTDKMAPIREVMDIFVKNCEKHYNPGSHVTIDEQLVPFRGRCPFKVYMKSKPAKYGIKIWVLADVDTSYCKTFQVYLGKQGNTPEREQGKRVVLDLVSVLDSGHGITTDNFFTSLELAEELLDKKLSLCGTLRKNKTCVPPEFLPSRDRRVCSSVFGFQPEVTLVSYVQKKNKCVILLSSEHNDAVVSEEDHKKPEIIGHYNATKGAVDTLDKMIAEYTCNRQTKRWPAVLFMNIIDIAAVNAFILWKNLHPEWNEQYLDKRRLFLLELGKQLTEPNIKRRINNPEIKRRLTRNTINSINSVLRDIGAEENVGDDEQTESIKKKPKQQRCTICPRKKDTKIKTTCSVCYKHVCAAHSKTIKLCINCDNH